jgi:hypothetical protein
LPATIFRAYRSKGFSSCVVAAGEQITGMYVECRSQANDILQADVPFTALDAANVRSVNPSLCGKRLLTETQSRAQ